MTEYKLVVVGGAFARVDSGFGFTLVAYLAILRGESVLPGKFTYVLFFSGFTTK